ncbi:MAG: site-specific DNA-methyltransferase, partial [Deltaproteobacteria bacterium]|nr:site-specific DNA-methyltransferase [Deltaproteobacteria bacterium]
VHTKGDKLVVVVRDDLATDDPKRKALALADNQIALLAEWDESVLEEIQFEIEESDFDIDLDVMGFDLVDEPIQEQQDPGKLIDRAEELNGKWKVERGQIWEIPGKAGTHRVMCGDSTDAGDVALLMNGVKAQCVMTSPPYWVGFDYEQEDKWKEVVDFISHFTCLCIEHVEQDGRIIINTGTVQAGRLTGQEAHMKLLIDTWIQSFEAVDWLMRYVRFWVKDGGLLHTAPQVDCIDQHTEFIGYFYNPKVKFRGQERTGEPWAGKGYWNDIAGAARQSGHVAAFPVEIPWRNILLFTRKTERILDPFLGSGTTVVAAEQEGRIALGMDVEPKYVAVTLERLSALGLEPKLVT